MMHLSLWGPLLIADTIAALLIVGAGVILGIQLHANARKTRIFRGVAALAVGVALGPRLSAGGGIAQGGEFDQPHPVGELWEHLPGDL